MALKHVLLTMLSRKDMTGYEIARNFDLGFVNIWHASHQQVYQELGRMKRNRLIEGREVEQTTKPSKIIYHLLPEGLDELKDWVMSETVLTKAKDDFLVKLIAGHVVPKSVLQTEVDRLRKVSETLLKELEEFSSICLSAPGKRSDYEDTIQLSISWGLHLLKARLEWMQEVDRYLESRT